MRKHQMPSETKSVSNGILLRIKHTAALSVYFQTAQRHSAQPFACFAIDNPAGRFFAAGFSAHYPNLSAKLPPRFAFGFAGAFSCAVAGCGNQRRTQRIAKLARAFMLRYAHGEFASASAAQQRQYAFFRRQKKTRRYFIFTGKHFFRLFRRHCQQGKQLPRVIADHNHPFMLRTFFQSD